MSATSTDTTKHTPGPWLREGTSVYALQQDGWRKGEPCMVNRFYAQVQFGRAGGELTPHEEVEANARLISAAPELLEALEWAVMSYNIGYSKLIRGQNDEHCAAVDRLRAALKKARGE